MFKSGETPDFFTDEFGNSCFLVYRNEAGSAYLVVPPVGASEVANAPRSDDERRQLVRQIGSVENFALKTPDIVERLNRAIPYGLEDFAVLVDAATEIERLRDLVELLGEALLSETTGGFTAIFDTTHAALDAWQEANHG